MTKKSTLLVIALMLAAACASSPTAPTSTPAAAAPIAPYRWDLVAAAPECHVATPTPNLTNVAPTSVVDIATGRRVLYAQGGPKANGDQDYIGGDFRALDKVWALCSWDRYTRGVNP